MSEKCILNTILAACAILALLSLLGLPIPPPASWLDAWTKWIATVVGIVMSARVLWSGSLWLQKLSR